MQFFYILVLGVICAFAFNSSKLAQSKVEWEKLEDEIEELQLTKCPGCTGFCFCVTLKTKKIQSSELAFPTVSECLKGIMNLFLPAEKKLVAELLKLMLTELLSIFFVAIDDEQTNLQSGNTIQEVIQIDKRLTFPLKENLGEVLKSDYPVSLKFLNFEVTYQFFLHKTFILRL